MTSISHALIGAAIAAKIPDPVIASGVALITHFICDLIPHWDLGTNWRGRPKIITGALAIVETLVAVIGTFLFFSSYVPNSTTLALAIFFSLVPDWLEAPYYIMLPNSPKAFYYLYKAQSYFHERLKWPEGALTQATVVAAFLIVGFVLK